MVWAFPAPKNTRNTHLGLDILRSLGGGRGASKVRLGGSKRERRGFKGGFRSGEGEGLRRRGEGASKEWEGASKEEEEVEGGFRRRGFKGA